MSDETYKSFHIIKTILIALQLLTIVLAITGLSLTLSNVIGVSTNENEQSDEHMSKRLVYCNGVAEDHKKCANKDKLLTEKDYEMTDLDESTTVETETTTELDTSNSDFVSEPSSKPVKFNYQQMTTTPKPIDCNHTEQEYRLCANETVNRNILDILLVKQNANKNGMSIEITAMDMSLRNVIKLINTLAIVSLVVQPVGLFGTIRESANVIILYSVVMALFSIHLLFIDIITGVVMTILTLLAFFYFHTLITTQSELVNKFSDLNKQV